MARKPVLEGGKKEEIIQKAMQLFFQHGYESTSIRMILEQVDGEVGMFYHYFKSKDELFEQVIECFFKNYQISFVSVTAQCSNLDELIEKILEQYQTGMEQYQKISKNMHWTIQYAFATRTIQSLLPAITELIQRITYSRKLPVDIVAAQLLYSISATLHSEGFVKMEEKEQKSVLLDICQRILED